MHARCGLISRARWVSGRQPAVADSSFDYPQWTVAYVYHVEVNGALTFAQSASPASARRRGPQARRWSQLPGQPPAPPGSPARQVAPSRAMACPTRDVEELLAERGITVDHPTVYTWVTSNAFWTKGISTLLRGGTSLPSMPIRARCSSARAPPTAPPLYATTADRRPWGGLAGHRQRPVSQVEHVDVEARVVTSPLHDPRNDQVGAPAGACAADHYPQLRRDSGSSQICIRAPGTPALSSMKM
jgi:hypothetical protein